MNAADEIFSRNLLVWGKQKQDLLSKSCLLIAGVGGLGSFVSEFLVRSGIGKLVIVDRGIVDRPDLNRQIQYTVKDLGKPKIEVAARKLMEIHGLTQIIPVSCDIRDADLRQIISLHQVQGIADCLDNFQSRFALERLREKGQFLVHGGVQEDYGQVTTIDSGSSHTLASLYSNMGEATTPFPVSVQAVSTIASLMVQEILNNLWNQPLLSRSLLIVELSDFTLSKIELS